MGVSEVPKQYLYTCDVCLKEKREIVGANVPPSSYPDHWARFKLSQAAHDFQGAVCGDASITRLLCDDCRPELIVLINEWSNNHDKIHTVKKTIPGGK